MSRLSGIGAICIAVDLPMPLDAIRQSVPDLTRGPLLAVSSLQPQTLVIRMEK